MLKALIFDFDGTLVDTETPWFEVCSAQFAAHGLELALPTYARCVGASLDAYDPYRDLSERLGHPEKRSEYEARARAAYIAREPEFELRPGSRELLEQARAKGLKLAVASSSDQDHVWSYLRRFEIADYFSTVCTRNLVDRVKPAPDLFLLALQKLGVEPLEALVFEDSPNGLLAALAAGIPAIIVRNPLTKTLPFREGARAYVDSFLELDAAALFNDQLVRN